MNELERRRKANQDIIDRMQGMKAVPVLEGQQHSQNAPGALEAAPPFDAVTAEANAP